MVVVIDGRTASEHSAILAQMFRLRARAFSERRGWRVVVTDGQERDIYDDLGPVYLVVVSGSGRVVASLRLLQTTGPHMLSDVFPETLPNGLVIRHPLIWESTRFCVDTSVVAEYGAGGINTVTGELLAALFELANKLGLENIVSVYDLFLERILRRAGCRFERLGDPYAYDGLKTVAGLFEVSDDAIRSIRDAAGLGDRPALGSVPAVLSAENRFRISA